LNNNDLISWKESLKTSKDTRYYNVRKRIDVANQFSNDSFLFEDVSDDSIYLVQNVLTGTKEQALTCSYIWLHSKFNLGGNPDTNDNTDPYVIYGISANSNITPVQDSSQGSNAHLKILYYGTKEDFAVSKPGRYCALLELL
jgi:hypothetical protein